MRLRTRVLTVVVGTGALVMLASPSYAHDCFNPQKNAHAPDGGVHYIVTGFDENGPIFVPIGNAKGIGGFVKIEAGVFGNPEPVYVHSIGNSSSKDVVGGPGSQKAEHACDGKGIDYLSACSGG